MLRCGAVVLFLLLFLAIVPERASAATTQDARGFVDEVGRETLKILNVDAAPSDEKQRRLMQLFSQHADMEWMGRFVLGASWAQASEQQRLHYMQAYRDYLLGRYTDNFSNYAGSHYVITGVRKEGEGQFTVNMNIQAPDARDKDTQAGYRLRAEDGQFKIVDIIVEGVSLITTQRSEFSAVVQRDGISGLINQLQAKTQTKPLQFGRYILIHFL